MLNHKRGARIDSFNRSGLTPVHDLISSLVSTLLILLLVLDTLWRLFPREIYIRIFPWIWCQYLHDYSIVHVTLWTRPHIQPPPEIRKAYKATLVDCTVLCPNELYLPTTSTKNIWIITSGGNHRDEIFAMLWKRGATIPPTSPCVATACNPKISSTRGTYCVYHVNWNFTKINSI